MKRIMSRKAKIEALKKKIALNVVWMAHLMMDILNMMVKLIVKIVKKIYKISFPTTIILRGAAPI